MNRRHFLLSSVSTLSALPLTTNSQANSYLTPLYQLILDNNGNSNGSWLDNVGLLPVGHDAFTVTGRSQEIYVDGDATNQGTGTQLSPFKDFYFLGGRNSAGQRFKSSIPIDPADTVIYVRGSFKHSDHSQDINGQFMRIHIEEDQMSDGSGGFNLFTKDKPLVFTPWPDQAGPIFDAENGSYPGSAGNSQGDSSPIFAAGSESGRYTDVEFRGFTVKNGTCANRMMFHQGCRSAKLISCRIFDGKPPSSSPAQSGGVSFEMSVTDCDHVIDHCEIYNNTAALTGNAGEVGWRSTVGSSTNKLTNKLVVRNSILRDGYHAFTGKHSGNTNVIAINNYIHSTTSNAIYARGGRIAFEYNLIKDCPGMCRPDYQNLNTSQELIFDHNTVINCDAIIQTTADTPALANGPVSVALTNNAFLDSLFSDIALDFNTLYDDGLTPTPDILTSSNNRFGFANPSAVFLQRKNQPDLNYTAAMSAISDSGSLFATPEINATTFIPDANGNCYLSGSGGTNIGAF
ncbi:MAG: hypothetical protein ACRBHB_08965 [Arenicella sp.]